MRGRRETGRGVKQPQPSGDTIFYIVLAMVLAILAGLELNHFFGPVCTRTGGDLLGSDGPITLPKVSNFPDETGPNSLKLYQIRVK
jgi:hypothetical protein